jgi:hypothetical protein
MKAKSILAYLFLAIFLIGGATAMAKTFPLTSDPSTPAASGTVKVKKDKNGNSIVELKTEHLAQPGMLTPPATAYVVWIQESGAEPMSQGQLTVGKSLKGDFKTTTKSQNFDVFITAESDPQTKAPSNQVVLRAKIQNVG